MHWGGNSFIILHDFACAKETFWHWRTASLECETEVTDEENRIIGTLYMEMYTMLCLYAEGILKNPVLAEEAVQETFQVACSKPERLVGSANPKGWLVKTLKFVMCNIQKRLVIEQNAYDLLGLQEGPEIGGKPDELPLNVIYGDLAQTEEFRLLLRISDGADAMELAKEQGISYAACRKRIQRSREWLRKNL